METPEVRTPTTLLIGATALIALVMASPGSAGTGPPSGAATSCPARVFAVTHFELEGGYGDVAPSGPSVGDTHSYTGPVYQPGSRTKVVGRMTGTGTTAAVNVPVPGQELRTVNLAFALPNLANQIAVGGVASYPTTSATLALATVTIRPITGGTGRFAGARGWLRTTHFGIGHWRQEFHVCRTPRAVR